MNWVQVLSSPVAGNLLLVLAALIGVFGSYAIYRRRTGDRREAIRKAFKKEVSTTSVLDTWIRKNDSEEGVPAQKIHPSTVYEGNTDDLGLLTEEEVEILVEFYSELIATNDMIEYNRDLKADVSMQANTVDTGERHREEAVRANLNETALLRWKAFQTLKKHLGEQHEPLDKMDLPEKAGGTVSGDHPMIKMSGEKLLEEGYFERVNDGSDLYRLTEDGEEFLNEDTGFTEKHDLDNELSLA